MPTYLGEFFALNVVMRNLSLTDNPIIYMKNRISQNEPIEIEKIFLFPGKER